MKQLNINITKAQLKSYSVTLEDGKPVISATCELLTEGGKPVTTYTASTKRYAWESSSEFELPIEAIAPIVELAKILENVVVKNCRDSQLGLESTVNTDPIQPQDLEALALPVALDNIEGSRGFPTIDDVDDKPIDLSEIPF